MAEEFFSALGFGEANIAQINSFFLMIGAVSSFIWATIGDRVSRKKIYTIISLMALAINTLLNPLFKKLPQDIEKIKKGD